VLALQDIYNLNKKPNLRVPSDSKILSFSDSSVGPATLKLLVPSKINSNFLSQPSKILKLVSSESETAVSDSLAPRSTTTPAISIWSETERPVYDFLAHMKSESPEHSLRYDEIIALQDITSAFQTSTVKTEPLKILSHSSGSSFSNQMKILSTKKSNFSQFYSSTSTAMSKTKAVFQKNE
jgi:hypothetical protein